MPAFNQTFDGIIDVSKLRRTLLHQLGLVTDVPPSDREKNVESSDGQLLTRHLRLLTLPLDTELVKYADQIAKIDSENVYRLMGVLHFGPVYHSGFSMDIFGTDITWTMTKKVRKMQKLHSGRGIPPFAPDVVQNDPWFVALTPSD